MGYAVEIEATRRNLDANEQSTQSAESVLIMDFSDEGVNMRAEEGDIPGTVDAFIQNVRIMLARDPHARVVFTSKTSANILNSKQQLVMSSYLFAPEADRGRLHNCLTEKLLSAGFLKQYRRWI